MGAVGLASATDTRGGCRVTTSAPQVPLRLPDKPFIAVLPFHNMSGDAEQEYFADGMVEDIITALSRTSSPRLPSTLVGCSSQWVTAS